MTSTKATASSFNCLKTKSINLATLLGFYGYLSTTKQQKSCCCKPSANVNLRSYTLKDPLSTQCLFCLSSRALTKQRPKSVFQKFSMLYLMLLHFIFIQVVPGISIQTDLIHNSFINIQFADSSSLQFISCLVKMSSSLKSCVVKKITLYL